MIQVQIDRRVMCRMLKTMTCMSDWHCRWRRRTGTSSQKWGGITGNVLDPKKIVEGAKQALGRTATLGHPSPRRTASGSASKPDRC